MTAPRPTYHLQCVEFDNEFDGPAEIIHMADARGGDHWIKIECGRGGKDLVGRRERALAILVAAIAEAKPPGCQGVIATEATLLQAKRAHPEIYGPPPAA